MNETELEAPADVVRTDTQVSITSHTTDRAERIATLELEIADRQRELRRLRLEQRDQDDARFLRVIATRVGDYAFSAVELLRHARVDDTLREAIGSRSPRAIGKRLSRLTSRDLEGFVLRCDGRDEDGCIWRIAQSC